MLEETGLLEPETQIENPQVGEEGTIKVRKQRSPNKPKDVPKNVHKNLPVHDPLPFRDNPSSEFVPQPQSQPKQSFMPPVEPKQRFSVPKQENIIYRLNEERQGTVNVVCQEMVLDSATGQSRLARLLRGATSIWFDEQEQFSKEYVGKNQIKMTFERGVCTIPVYEKSLLQFAELSNMNWDNPNRVGVKKFYFTKWNPAAIAEQGIKDENDVIEAMQIAATAKIDDIIPHAQYMNIPFADEMGVPLDENSIRKEYMKAAKNEPSKFLKSIHSPLVSMAHKVRRAITEGKIDLGKMPNQAYWVDGGYICALPIGRDQTEFLIEYGQMQGERSMAFASQLNSLLQ